MTQNYTNPSDPGRTSTHPAELSASEFAKIFGKPRLDHDLTHSDPTPMTSDDDWVHPMIINRQRKANRSPVDKFLPNRLRSEVAIQWPGAPDSVLESQRAALNAISRLEEAGRAVKDVGEDKRAETARHEAAVAQAYRNDKSPPKRPDTDWVAKAIERRLQYGTALEMAIEAVRDFGRVRENATAEWRAALISQVEPSHAEARRLMHEAASAIRNWRAAVDGAHKLAVHSGQWSPSWHRSASRTNVATAVAALTELLALVDDEDAVVSGAYLYRDDEEAQLNPPAWTRAALRREAGFHPAGEASIMLDEIRKADAEGAIAPCAAGKTLHY